MNTKQNSKSLLNFLWLLLIVPVMFVFAACGGGNGQLDTKAKCDTSGTYATAATADEMNEALGTQTGFATDGYRVTADIKTTTTASGTGLTSPQTYTLSVGLNMIMTEDAAALKMIMPDFEKMMQGNMSATTTGYVYYTDGFLYTNFYGEKIKEAMNLDAALGMLDYQGGSSAAFTDAASVLDILDGYTSENLTVTKQGNNFKIVISNFVGFDLSEAEMGATVEFGDATIYLNFDEEGNLTALQLGVTATMSATTSGVTTESTMEMTFTMSGFDGDIEFPSFNGYEEAEPEQELK